MVRTERKTTIDYDGIPVFFKENVADDPVDLEAFTMLYFTHPEAEGWLEMRRGKT